MGGWSLPKCVRCSVPSRYLSAFSWSALVHHITVPPSSIILTATTNGQRLRRVKRLARSYTAERQNLRWSDQHTYPPHHQVTWEGGKS